MLTHTDGYEGPSVCRLRFLIDEALANLHGTRVEVDKAAAMRNTIVIIVR